MLLCFVEQTKHWKRVLVGVGGSRMRRKEGGGDDRVPCNYSPTEAKLLEKAPRGQAWPAKLLLELIPPERPLTCDQVSHKGLHSLKLINVDSVRGVPDAAAVIQ